MANPAGSPGSSIPTRDKAFLTSVFQSVDRDRSSTLTGSELQRALANGTWKPFKEDLVNMMVKMFDRDFTNRINFDQFVCLWHHITQWINAFKKIDKGNAGRLNKMDLQAAFQLLNFKLSVALCHVMIRRFDRNGDNRISVEDFVRLCICLQNATEAFKIFDKTGAGSAKITYDQFITTMFRMAK